MENTFVPKSKQLKKTSLWPAGAWQQVSLEERAWGLNHLQGQRAALRNVDGIRSRPVKATPGLSESLKPFRPCPCPAPLCGVPTALCQRSMKSLHWRLFQATVGPLLLGLWPPSRVIWCPSPLSSPHPVPGSITGLDARLCNGLFSPWSVLRDCEHHRVSAGIYRDPGYS